jgi:hypothetical protein
LLYWPVLPDGLVSAAVAALSSSGSPKSVMTGARRAVSWLLACPLLPRLLPVHEVDCSTPCPASLRLRPTLARDAAHDPPPLQAR